MDLGRKDVPIRVFSKELNFLGEIDNYTSLIYTRKWRTYNSFEFHISEFDGNLIKRGNFILVGKDRYLSGVIEYFQDNEKETKDITVKGYCPRSLLFNRPCFPPFGQEYDTYNTECENVIYGLIEKNCINPSNKNRVIPFLGSNASKNRGEKLSFQTTYKVISEEIETLCASSGLGTAVRFDPQEDIKLLFEVLEGTDRTYDNGQRPPYIFARKLDRISERNYTESQIDYKNVAYVAGQGEGANREMITIGDDITGFDRRELFIDARDIEEGGSLEDRGKLKLADYGLVKSFEAIVDPSDYRNKWDLGDYVTVLDDKTGIREDRQILEVQETFEDGCYSVEPTMGEPLKSVGAILKRSASTAIDVAYSSGSSVDVNPLSQDDIDKILV